MNDDLEPVVEETKPASPLAQVSRPPAKGLPSVQEALTKQITGLDETRTAKKDILNKAITNLQGRLTEQQGMQAEDYFRLTQSLLSPTKTGGFAETLGNVAGAAGDMIGKRKQGQAGIQDLMDKYKLQAADVDADYLGQTAQAVKALQGSNASKSPYGKQAEDEGLMPGTPEFATRVQELAQTKAGPTEDAFDKKTGNFITANGVVVPKTEVTKDREERGKLLDAKLKFKQIDKKTIDKAHSFFNVTGSGYTGDLGKGIAGTIAQDTLDAQTKIFTQAIEGIQKALPPGPASDKDVQQAKATFPGFSSKKALRNWLKSLEDLVDSHISRQDQKYGSEKWYGAGGSPKASGERNDLGETPAESKRLKNQPKAAEQPPPGVPKPGAVLNGHRFKGGDPSKQESWEKV